MRQRRNNRKRITNVMSVNGIIFAIVASINMRQALILNDVIAALFALLVMLIFTVNLFYMTNIIQIEYKHMKMMNLLMIAWIVKRAIVPALILNDIIVALFALLVMIIFLVNVCIKD